MAFADLRRAVDLGDAALRVEQRLVGAEPHRAAEIAVPSRCSTVFPRIHSVISPITGWAHGPNSVEPAPDRRARWRAASMTAICMPKQMPKYGTCRSRKTHRLDLAFGAALAEAARHQDRVHPFKLAHRLLLGLEHLGIDPRRASP